MPGEADEPGDTTEPETVPGDADAPGEADEGTDTAEPDEGTDTTDPGASQISHFSSKGSSIQSFSIAEGEDQKTCG